MKRAPATHRSLLQACCYRALFALAFLAPACHLGQDTKEEETLSFSQRYDSLSLYDSLVIEVKDSDGRFLAVIFGEKATSPAQLDNLDVPGWDGGPIIIVISGYKHGQAGPVYQEEKSYDGDTRHTDSTLIRIHPHPTLSTTESIAPLQVGQRAPLPRVDVHPSNLADPGLTWTSDNSGIAAVEGGELAAVSPGTARITVKLARDTAKLVFTVQVSADPQVPTRLLLDRDTLRLALQGAPGRFGIEAQPAAASRDVTWRLSDSTVAALLADGSFLALAEGVTRAWAVSKLDPSVKDSGWIAVGKPVAVAAVRFLRDTLVLHLGGAPESLAVEVLPALANPEVLFSLSDSSKASLTGNLLSAKAAGDFTVVVRSRENSALSDILPVSVREPVRVERVEALEQEVTLYLGAPARSLTAKVYPELAPQGVHWKSLAPTIVSAQQLTGEIAPLKAGLASIVVSSRADTSAHDTVAVTVKADPPRLTAGPDTVVSTGETVAFRIGVAQEFGQVVMFQWDLDGDLAWDDSLAGPWTGTVVSLPPVSRKYDKAGTVVARFRVRDTEGNTALAERRLQVTGGAAVSIEFPKDNSYTNQRSIRVDWSVNGVPQDSLTSENLAVAGPNPIVRTVRDSAGKVRSASVTVHLDTVPPAKPVLSGTSPTNLKPKWNWTSGGGGGSGEFRFRSGDANFPADAPTTRDSVYTLAVNPVSGTTYTLYVQERDLAGNWSQAGSLAIRYDVTSPVVAIASPLASGTYYTSLASVSLSGTAGGPLPIARVTYRLGTGLPAAATLTAAGWSTPAIALQEGVPVAVTVLAEDGAGNSGEAVLNLLRDATPPAAPAITAGPNPVVSVLRGTFAWSAGGDGASGSGLNGRYRYSLNNGTWKDTAATLLSDLPLAAGNNVFAVQEQDRALQWSASATRTVRTDTSGPVITLTSHANPATSQSLTATLSGTVRDTGSAMAGMIVSGQVSGSGTVTVTGTTWTTAALTLRSGANTLLLTATDTVDNVRTLSVTVNVSVPAPVVVITNPADSLTITNQPSIAVTYTIDGGAAQIQIFTLTGGVNRLVVASPPNVSGNIGRDTVKVTYDGTGPNAPTLTRVAALTNGTATWNWTSNGDNAGGAGVRSPGRFRYSLNGGTVFTEVTATKHEIPAEGTYTLVVQEQDKAGNWSASSTAQTVTVDKTGPSVVISGPAANYVTNQPSVTVTYKVDNGAATTNTCALNFANGANTCLASATDAAGNTTTVNVTVYRRNAFFFTPGGAGTGSGNDWQNAGSSEDLSFRLNSPNLSGKELWIGTGTYPDRLQTSQTLTMLGGFNAAALPFNSNNRNKTGTVLTGYFQAEVATNLVMDGFVMGTIGVNAGSTTLTDVTFVSAAPNIQTFGLYLLQGANVTANNITISRQSFGTAAVFVSESALTLSGGSIDNNTCEFGSALNLSPSTGRTVRLKSGFALFGNFSNAGNRQVSLNSGTLVVDSDIALKCGEISNEGGTVQGCDP